MLTLGSIAKQWIVPGWRLGWIAMIDPSGVLKKSGIAECLQDYLEYSANPATIIQGAVPHLLEKTSKDFFSNINNILKEAIEAFYTKVQEIPCLTCPYKPEGAMCVMIKLNLSFLEGINDDMEFCTKLAHEESVIILPGMIVGLKNWLRVTFAMELAILEEELERIKAFCLRHTISS
ncbi:Tyrosine aminotransferase [Capsicum annuum]|uniref:Tyrosine aminotransferase n=1 Tax=Capsicum annuum TaxID=4072 RepID=A0A2G2ZT08_CAPAN|nr:Tyrosine aminotransferase [Capsicum annuum]